MVDLRRQLTRNVWTSWLGYLVRLAISFLFVPYITAVLGDARYGVWVIVFQTINYFTLLDFGLEKALVTFISRHLGQRTFDRINRTLNTTTVLYLAIGSVIIVGAWLAATFLFGFFRIEDPALAAEGRSALIIIGVYMGTRLYLLPFAGALAGFQRFDIGNSLYIIEDIVRTVVMVLLLMQGHGLAALALAILGTSLVRQVIAIVWVRRLYPHLRFDLKQADRATARDLLDYSKITFAITLGWLVIYNTDSVLLGLMSSAAAAGIFAPAAQLMLYLRNVINVVASPLSAAASQMAAENNVDGVRRLYLKGIRYASYFSFFAAVGVIIYARPFVDLWLVPQFAASAEVMRILAIGTAVFIPQIVGNAILFGIDRHRYLLRVVIIEAVLKLGLSLMLIGRYGMLGMAWAATIPQALLYATLYPVYIGRALSLEAPLIVMTMLRSAFVGMFVSLPPAILLSYLLPPDSWWTFGANVAIVCGFGLIGAYFVLDAEDRARLRPGKKTGPDSTRGGIQT